MPKSAKRESILLDIESVYKTEEAPDAATDGILVEDLDWNFADVLRAERTPKKATFGKLRSVHAGELVEITGTVEVKTSGVGGTAPEVGKLLRSLGFAEAVIGGNTVLYSPVSASASQASATVHYYDDGSLYKFVGCRGTGSLSASVGEIMRLSFTLTGHFLSWEDAATPTITYSDAVPPAFGNVTFDLDGYSPSISSLELDFGNEVSKPKSATSASAYGEIIITDRLPSGSFDPEHTTKAVKDWIDEWKTSTGLATTVTFGADLNQIILTMGDLFYTDLPKGERDGVRTLDIPFECGGTPPFTLAFS